MTKNNTQEYYNTIDQMGRDIIVPRYPKRIVSLVPSQTELLYELGLTDEVVGQTIFCIHPLEQHGVKPRIGGTKKLSFEKIAALKPDLIIGNKEENEQGQIEELMKHYPVWMSDIKTLEDACEMIVAVGSVVGKNKEAIELKSKIVFGFESLPKIHPASCLYFIWRKPWMVAGHDTFIADMLNRIGLANLANTFDGRYPILTHDDIRKLSPQYILLSSEPYPFADKHIKELESICPNSKIVLVNGEMFSWYGSRLVDSIDFFKNTTFRKG
ncbi:MAG: helical backbone metal receptor [Bacteroidota bacterium]|nr:helical backbone metal receptor [Bacteroidota bacterium]